MAIYKIIKLQAFRQRDLLFVLRDQNYNKFVVIGVDFYPYCFVNADRKHEITGQYAENIERIEDERFVNEFGDKVFRIYMDAPKNVGQLRKTNENQLIHQADVPYEMACALDIGVGRYIKISKKLSSWQELSKRFMKSPTKQEIEDARFPPYIKKYIDIEVLIPPGAKIDTKGKHPVISVQINDTSYIWVDRKNRTKILPEFEHSLLNRTTTVKKFDTETEMITAVFDDLFRGDIAISFTNYDKEYLENRSLELGLKLSWNIIQWFDFQLAYANNLEFTTTKISLKQTFDLLFKYKRDKWKLLPPQFQGFFAKKGHEIIENEDDFSHQYIQWRKTQSGGAVRKLYLSNRFDELLFYNACDVYDMIALENVAGIDAFLGLHDQLGLIVPDNVFVHTFKEDPSFLHLCMLNKIASRSVDKELLKREKDEEEKMKGALVHEPETGRVLENVMVFDFGRFYPSIIRAKDASSENNPEQFKPKKLIKKLPDGTILDDPMFILPAMAYYYVKARDEVEKKLSSVEDDYLKEIYKTQKTAYKDLTSGMWGYISSPRVRYYSRRVGEIILAESRRKNRELKIYLENNEIAGYYFKVVYGDTDSSFPKIKNVEDIKQINFDAITDQLNEYLKEICDRDNYPVPITVKPEKLYLKLVLVKKKNYYGETIWKDGEWLDEPDYDIKGLQTIRGDHSQFSKDFQYSFIIIHLEKGLIEVRKHVARNVKYLQNGLSKAKYGKTSISFVEKIAKPISFTEKFDYYLYETDDDGKFILDDNGKKIPKRRGAYFYYVESAKAWNKFVDDEELKIGRGSKAFMIPIKNSKDEFFQKCTYIAFTDATKINWTRIKLNDERIIKNNVLDKISNILVSLRMGKKQIKSMMAGKIIKKSRF